MFDNFMKNIKNAFGAFTKKDYLQAAVAGSLMVCFADSEADEAEKAAVWQRMVQCEQLKSFTPKDIQEEFEKQVLWWTEEGESIARIKSLHELGEAKKLYDYDDRQMLMAIFEQIAKASEGVSAVEKAALSAIREKLNVDYLLG